MNGEMITNSGGADGVTTVLAQANAAYVASETLINGGNMKAASEAAQKEIDSQSEATFRDRKVNQGDKILYHDNREKK